MIRKWLKRVVLWVGLVLCAYALWRTRALAGDAIGRIGAVVWLLIGFLLAASWLLAVMTWRQYLVAYVGRVSTWRTAMRQVGLLLVGKYVPGGAFGFLARLYDQPDAPRGRLFWAGLAEQAVGVAMPIVLGALLLFAAKHHNLLWLGFALPLPILAVGGVWALHRVAGALPWLRRRGVGIVVPSWWDLLGATALQLVLQAVWVTTIVVVVGALFDLNAHAALGLAGAFLLAVAAGMLVVIAPGGIGVREATLVGLAGLWLDTVQAVFLSALLRVLSTMLDLVAGVVAGILGRMSVHRSPDDSGDRE